MRKPSDVKGSVIAHLADARAGLIDPARAAR